ncbi:splicing branch point binding protein [Encephalitozoon intestinalis ATCC 50506]|uniref:Splicing branch point binding protein n=1 Tax=Encephalitozoon intestinalis (strain ATCC 50506) TaxID=876142 RepID=E0S5X4_ENCIT|nr:splicing branch point binding protein [Encephalitozoon intestinalis ATCC 50506]ADM11109.1 splicing branch point binding protein [Encephalitozoon intestinalis ATCC 50506]UTX44763.1 alternative splicing factor Quaking [Encephalitozoon intestinalis]
MELFRHPEKVPFPKDVKSKSELKKLLCSMRSEEIDRRLRNAVASNNQQLVQWLKSRKQQILGLQIQGNVSISGNMYTNKIYIPVQEFPESNFVGLIIGPKGSTQRQLERITKARIYIRGSYKDKYAEPLHCYISADTQENLMNASAVIENLIEDSILFGSCKLKSSQLQAMKGSKGDSGRRLTDWEKFYYWWYFHNKIQKEVD